MCAGLQGTRERIVIENLVNMAFELGMEVVCEGVETQAQVDVLQDIAVILPRAITITVRCRQQRLSSFWLKTTAWMSCNTAAACEAAPECLFVQGNTV